MKKVIARVKLNPGQGGYFDPITRIHLTHGDPERDIYAGMNTEGIRAAVRSKRISLVSGSLGNFVAPFKLIKTADGKVVLVDNKVTKSKDQQFAEKKIQQRKEAVVEPKKEVEQPVINPFKAATTIPDLKLDIPSEEVKEEIKEEVKKIVQEPEVVVEEVSEQSQDEEETAEEEKISPFKKSKKKHKKSHNEENQ